MTALTNVAAIFEKEWRHYFGGPIAYVVVAVWALLFGLFFDISLTMFIQRSTQMMGGGMSVNDYLIEPLLNNMTVTAMFLLPMLTMRLFAEERRLGTVELLATTPLTDVQVVLGKFLAALALWALMIVTAVASLSLLWKFSTPAPDWKPLAVAMVGMLLYGGCYIALGMFLSTVTSNQVVAAVLSFSLFLALLVMNWLLDDPTGGNVMKVLGYLSLTGHLRDFMRGVIDLKDVVFYLSVITFGLFISHQSVASQRWRA
jgi:ABC-2 type transport system permease protein